MKILLLKNFTRKQTYHVTLFNGTITTLHVIVFNFAIFASTYSNNIQDHLIASRWNYMQKYAQSDETVIK